MAQLNSGGAIPAYRVDGQGQPLVLIMGVGGTKEAWAFQTRAFRPYYRVITFDNRGVGRSEGQQRPFTIEVMVNDTLALLDHLGIDQAHILGYSLGGIVAQEIAIGHPERVMKLILASTLARGGATQDVTIGARRALGLEPGDRRQRVEILALRHIMPSLIELSFNRWEYRLALGLLARLYVRRIRPEGLAGQMQAAASANTLDRLDRIEATTLVLTGTGDRLIDPSASKLLASRIPHAELVMIEGGSHAMAIEMRGSFNAAVLDFLRED
jgi:pimeloyl-ACP methyl ester carboxylesterase